MVEQRLFRVQQASQMKLNIRYMQNYGMHESDSSHDDADFIRATFLQTSLSVFKLYHFEIIWIQAFFEIAMEIRPSRLRKSLLNGHDVAYTGTNQMVNIPIAFPNKSSL